MEFTLAKITQRGSALKYRIIITEVSLFDLPGKIDSYIEYSPSHNLDEDSWFGIAEFSKKAYFLAFLENNIESTNYPTLDSDEFEKIEFIISVQGTISGRIFCFQKVTRSQMLKHRFLTLGDRVRYVKETRSILVNEIPDAIYYCNEDILYFRRLSSLTTIFPGIDSLYREATFGETKAFLENKFINLENDFNVDMVKQANRKRIAMAIDTFGSLDEQQKKSIFASVKEFCPDLVKEDGLFNIKSELDLKLLLFGIDQRFYTTADGRQKRIANSIIPLNALHRK